MGKDYNLKVNKKLKKYWGFDSLKEKQIEVINSFLNKNDVIGLLPTGYGKSLCYLLPPLVKKKVIFIVSPLISLMEDQKEKLQELNLPVACLHGNNMRKDKEIFDIIDGNIKIVYMSPEYLVNGEGFELAKTLFENKMLGFLAVDESHCISVWGHDFRNSYLKLKIFREKFPKIPILALTATATRQVVEEISNLLNLKEPKLIKARFDRPNLYLKCVKVDKLYEKIDGEEVICRDIVNNNLKPYLNKYNDGSKIIIYMNSRKNCQDMTEVIKSMGFQADCYHAGLSKGLRNKIQTQFSSGNINIIISTVAFGMGIDQIVRCVLIFGAPSSIEDYYQQIGRAGRDSKPAETILFFQYKNIAISKHLNKKANMDFNIIKHKSRCLDTMARYFYTNTCRRRFILEYFGEIPKFFCCSNCDNCCENDMKDYTVKIHDCLFNKKHVNKVFNSKDVNILLKNNIIDIRDRFCQSIHNWKKIIELNHLNKPNKNINNLPNKYRIKLA